MCSENPLPFFWLIGWFSLFCNVDTECCHETDFLEMRGFWNFMEDSELILLTPLSFSVGKTSQRNDISFDEIPVKQFLS